jgi:hypothetical protein
MVEKAVVRRGKREEGGEAGKACVVDQRVSTP